MPWFPQFVAAAELARRQTRATALADPVTQYFTALVEGDTRALEYHCFRWGSYDLPPQAGIAVFERGPDGLLAAARVYDDVKAPARRS